MSIPMFKPKQGTYGAVQLSPNLMHLAFSSPGTTSASMKKATPSLMDKDLINGVAGSIGSGGPTEFQPGQGREEINFDDYVRNLDELVNSKVAQGFQMMIQKIVVLIEEQVKCRVNEEVAEQLAKLVIKGKLMQQLPNQQAPYFSQIPTLPNQNNADQIKFQEAKSNKDVQVDESCSTSEIQQQVSVLDMEQSLSKIDKIDEETEEDGTCHSHQNGGNSVVIREQMDISNSKDQLTLIQSRVTLPHEESEMTNGINVSLLSHTHIDVSVEQPMQATVKSKNIQSLRRSKDNLATVLNMNSSQNSTVATTNYQATLEKNAKTLKPRKAPINQDKQQNVKSTTTTKKMVIGTWSKNSSIIKKRTDQNSPGPNPNQQGLETGKTSLLSTSTLQNQDNIKLRIEKVEKKPIELSNAGQKLRNQINNRVTNIGTRGQGKEQDVAHISKYQQSNNSLKSSFKDSALHSVETERQTGPVALNQSKLSQIDEFRYNTIGIIGQSRQPNQIIVRNSCNVPIKRIQAQTSPLNKSNYRRTHGQSPANSERNQTGIGGMRFATQPSSNGSSKRSNRDRERTVSPTIHAQISQQNFELQRQTSGSRGKVPIITFAKDRSRQSGLKNGSKLKTSPTTTQVRIPSTARTMYKGVPSGRVGLVGGNGGRVSPRRVL